jgi:hypothetical protein
MTKRLSAVALCLVAVLAMASTAQAQKLTYRSAQKLAKRLALKQVQHRSIVSFHVLKGKTTRSGAVVFPYDDRSTANVYCTAVIVVRQRHVGKRTFQTARFRGQACNGVPGQALDIETATRAAQRSLRGTALATATSLERFRRAIGPCRTLRVPRSREADAQELVDVGLTEAIVRPNDSALGGFITALSAVKGDDPVLTDGTAAWADYLSVLRGLPDVSDPCAAAKAWAQHGWSPAAAPVDFAALKTLVRRATADNTAIDTAATRLAEVGVFPTTALGFTPRGLLLGLTPRNLGITGGQGRPLMR